MNNAFYARMGLFCIRLKQRQRAAQGIEAATAAETVKQGSVHESPVAESDAPKGNRR